MYFAFIFSGKDTGFSFLHFITNAKEVFFRLFARLILRIPDGGMFALLSKQQKFIWTFASWIFGLLSIGLSYIQMTSENKKSSKRHALQLLNLWTIVILLFFGIYKKSIYDYYLGIFFIVPFLFSAVALKRIWNTGTPGRIISIIVIVFLLMLNWQGRPFKYEPNNQLEQTKKIAKAVLDKTEGKPFNFALITGGNSDHAYRYFFEIWGKPPVTIENSIVDPNRQTVTDQLLIVCEDPKCMPLGNSLWEVAGFGRAEIVGSWDVSVLKVYKLIHYMDPQEK